MSTGKGLLKHARLTRRQLIAFTLASAAINGVITASVGAWLAQTYSAYQSQRQSIDTISNLLYDRRTRAGMVASSIRRNAEMEEVRERKRAYDEAYAAWNSQVRRNLFVIRDVFGDGRGGQAKIEQDFEDSLVAALADVDRCITKAYDVRVSGGDGPAVLAACQMPTLHQFVLDCGSTFMNELDKLTRLSFLPFSSQGGDMRAKGEARIRKGCTRAAEPPTPGAAPASPPSSPAPPSTAPPAPALESPAPAAPAPAAPAP